MILMIVGAGASYDSVPLVVYKNMPSTLICRPPLANEVFDNRVPFHEALQEHPELMGVVPRLRPPDDNRSFNLEAELEVLASEQSSYPQRAGQLLAVSMYLAEIIDGCSQDWGKGVGNNYEAVLDRLSPVWRAGTSGGGLACVTFNYDTLLDEAIQQATDHSFDNVADYISLQQLPLFKLHGSVNWRRPIGSNYVSHRDRPKMHAGSLNPGPIEVGYWGHGGIDDYERYLPALAVPMQEKDVFECPDRHVDRLRSLLPEIRRVLVIGWKGQEAKFLELLREHLSEDVGFLIVDLSLIHI